MQLCYSIFSKHWGRLDCLIHNASTFFATPIKDANESQWEQLMTINLKIPFFLSQRASYYLRQHQGCIINITDIHAEKTFAPPCYL